MSIVVVRPMRIVVGVDDSHGAGRALRWARDEARLRGAHVQAVHAWHYPYLPTPPFMSSPSPGCDDLEVAARDELDHAVDGVDQSELAEPIERTLVWSDSAASALLAESKGADLLVVGSRGRGGFASLLLGSVSQEVAHHASCPVVIVPAE
jgi:nucleotide-binding universal stress UspA family protein